jgi:hypothetical protein
MSYSDFFAATWPLLVACSLMFGLVLVAFVLSRVERHGQVKRMHYSRQAGSATPP